MFIFIQHHPDKNPPHKKAESEKKIKAINEAYEVLGDKKKREMYDLQGADNFNPNGPSPNQGFGQSGQYQQPSNGGFTFTSGGFPGTSPGGNQWFDPSSGTFTQTFSSANFGGSGGGAGAGAGGMGDIFEMMERMFGGGSAGMGSSGNPFASFSQPQGGAGGRTGGRSKGGTSSAAGRRQSASGAGASSGSGSSRRSRSHARDSSGEDAFSSSSTGTSRRPKYEHAGNTNSNNNNKPTVVSVECTLEELYAGKTKSLKVRDKVPMGAQQVQVEKVYKVDIKPGFKSGTKVKFPASEEFPKPVEFEVTEVRHKYFTRKGDDLHWVCKLTPRQVIKGVTIKVPLLDGTTLTLDSTQYSIKDGAKVPFEGLGMPIAKKTSSSGRSGGGKTHGDLIVKFEVQ